jgi:hypothetical protein
MINKIQENLKKVLQDIRDNFDEDNYVEPPHRNLEDYVFEEEEDDSDPYEGASWGAAENWHCIRCGSALRNLIDKTSPHGKICFANMRKTKVFHYLCSNKDCFHYNGPLTLHHPFGGPDSPAGESYSISWVR